MPPRLANPQVQISAQSLRGETKRRPKGRVGRFASWNVRSLVEDDGGIATACAEGSAPVKEEKKIYNTVRQFQNSHIEVAALQETKWFDIAVYSVGDAQVLSSGRPVPRVSARVRSAGYFGCPWTCTSSLARRRMSMDSNKFASRHRHTQIQEPEAAHRVMLCTDVFCEARGEGQIFQHIASVCAVCARRGPIYFAWRL